VSTDILILNELRALISQACGKYFTFSIWCLESGKTWEKTYAQTLYTATRGARCSIDLATFASFRFLARRRALDLVCSINDGSTRTAPYGGLNERIKLPL